MSILRTRPISFLETPCLAEFVLRPPQVGLNRDGELKNPLGLGQSGFCLALAEFIKRPQAELKSAHYESDYPLRIRAVKLRMPYGWVDKKANGQI